VGRGDFAPGIGGKDRMTSERKKEDTNVRVKDTTVTWIILPLKGEKGRVNSS